MPFNAFVRPKHFPAALLSEGKRPQKPLQSLFSWKVSNRNAAARNKKLLGRMTFARRAKECFDSCEQNVWTCSVVVRCQNLIVANVGTSSTRPILFRHLKCHGQVRYGPNAAIPVKEISFSFNPFTPKSAPFQISPAASPVILHYTVWRTWLFIAYSDKILLYYKFSLPHLYISLLEGWEWKGSPLPRQGLMTSSVWAGV